MLAYFETLCVDTGAANVLINSSLTILIVRMLRNARMPALRVRLASVLGLLVRHATYIADELVTTGERNFTSICHKRVTIQMQIPPVHAWRLSWLGAAGLTQSAEGHISWALPVLPGTEVSPPTHASGLCAGPAGAPRNLHCSQATGSRRAGLGSAETLLGIVSDHG